MKLSIFLILYLFLTPNLVDSTNSDDENEQTYFNRFQYRDGETSGTGNSGHGGTGTGSIPSSTGGYSQGMYSGTEHSQNWLALNRGFGNNPFLNSPQHLQGNPSGHVPQNWLQLGYGNYPYQHHHIKPSGQEPSQNLLNLDLTLGINQSLYPTQHQHTGAIYPQGTNPSGQESSQNWLNLGLNPEMNSSGQKDDNPFIVKTKRGWTLNYGGYNYNYYSQSDKMKTITWVCNKNRSSECKGKVVTKGIKFEILKELTNDELNDLKIGIEFKSKHTCVKKGKIINGNVL
ncbi:unnamed protein product [Meloidogyne enterolobii]|uniref:Uncharacterized protein n=1 Tax=Meloidogyne enterolobii TaxID=390850 RepID=A0ACB1B9W9_MELEN